MAQLWGGRFTKETDKLVYNFNASISFDQKFYKQDIKGSMAHVKMLAKQGILTEEERDQILDATLDDIHALADLVDAALKQNNICVVGSEAAIQKEKELFKNVENL